MFAARNTMFTDTGLAAETVAFAAASGATDLGAIDDLVVYLKENSLLSNARFFPLKAAQNAGSGTTVYGLGGLTSNNMTINNPTWNSDGIQFGATSSGDQTTFPASVHQGVAFTRFWVTSNPAGVGSARLFNSAFDGTDNRFYAGFGGSGGYTAGKIGVRIGTASAASSTMDIPSSDSTFVLDTNGNGWENKSSVLSYTPTVGGSGITEGRIRLAPNTGEFLGTMVAHLVFYGSLTTAQRETITDLINAL